MPLHKYPPKIWDALKLKQGVFSRLPKHYLKSLETKEPTPVHWKPLGVQYRVNPATGQKERVQDVPIPIHYPPQSQDGLWGGEGWISGYRYANNDKVSLREDVSVFCLQSELFTVNRLWYKMSVKRLCSYWFVFCFLTCISLSVVVNSSQEDLEATAVKERTVQRDPRPQVHHHSHSTHAGPHRCRLRIRLLHS